MTDRVHLRASSEGCEGSEAAREIARGRERDTEQGEGERDTDLEFDLLRELFGAVELRVRRHVTGVSKNAGERAVKGVKGGP